MNLENLIQYIENNLKEDISLEDMSKLANYSARQIYYGIKELTGMPVMGYIRYRRMEAAAREIANGRSFYETALDYGFDTQAGFYKAFICQIGCSPREYSSHEKRYRIRKNLSQIERLSEDSSIMKDIVIRKVKQEDAKSMWENIYSRNTPKEVEERIAESISEMNAGHRVSLAAVIEDNVIGTIQFIRHSHKIHPAPLV